MRSILALRGSRAALTGRCQHLRTPAAVHHRHRRLRSPDDVCQRQSLAPVPRPRPRLISTSSAFLSSPDSFHGLPLSGEKETIRQHPPKIEEAEVVASEEDRSRTRELIKEVTRAEMSAHSIVPNDEKDEEEAKSLGAYERRLQQLNDAKRHHQNIDRQLTSAYAQSCMNMGELNYQLGDMDQSQNIYMDALKELLRGSDEGNAGSDRIQMMIAQSMHALGAIHARCGEYDEASRWYEESLMHKHKISADGIDGIEGDSLSASIFYHYELGKTYNGLAALEVMKGGDVQWEKAMSLFQQAERNYLRDHEETSDQQDEHGMNENDAVNATNATNAPSTSVSKAAIQQMTPRHLESLIDVRSNMGELLRQRGNFEPAVEKFRSALDMARMALANEYEKVDADGEIHAAAAPDDGPGPREQGNAIVDLLIKIADNLISAENFNEAAEAYEQALTSHLLYRRPSSDANEAKPRSSNVLPATIAGSTKIKFDLDAATTIEAATRNNLAHALAQIGQDKLSLEHYEASLAIKRRIGGDLHAEVARTLCGMGALLGGPLRDFTKALNCFKEALYIYRTNLDELCRAAGGDGDGEGRNAFLGDENAEEIDRHIQNTLKNISLIEAALLKDRDGASKRRRR